MNYVYEARPCMIEAFQITNETRYNENDWPLWLKEARKLKQTIQNAVYEIDGMEGFMIASMEGHHACPIGNFIIKGLHDELYSCDPVIFNKKYKLKES